MNGTAARGVRKSVNINFRSNFGFCCLGNCVGGDFHNFMDSEKFQARLPHTLPTTYQLFTFRREDYAADAEGRGIRCEARKDAKKDSNNTENNKTDCALFAHGHPYRRRRVRGRSMRRRPYVAGAFDRAAGLVLGGGRV